MISQVKSLRSTVYGLRFGVALSLLLFLSSCKKENLCDCLKSTGNIITEQRWVSDFSKIELHDNVILILTQDSVNSIRVEAGEHLIPLIKTNVNDGILSIENDNKCNWVRSYAKKIYVYVHAKKIRQIDHSGSETMQCQNAITSDTFDLNIKVSGSANVILNTQASYLRLHASNGTITASGYSYFNYTHNVGTGFTHFENLQTHDSSVEHQGTGNCYVSATNDLSVHITGSGNVYYYGNPVHLAPNITGSGQLIHVP